MSVLSRVGQPAALPASGTAPEPLRNPVGERLRLAKREAVESALGKGESWATKVINGESGIRLDDLPPLMAFLGLKAVSVEKVCIDPELARSYECIARKAMSERSLFDEDAE